MVEVSTGKESSDLSCESSAPSFSPSVPQQSCDMSDYADDEPQGVVTRVKVAISH